MIILPQAKETRLGYTLSLEDYAMLTDTEKTHFLHDFVYQSNYIEGISDHWVQTICVGQTPYFPPTLTSHEKAFKQILNNAQNRQTLDIKGIKKLHEILMEGLLLGEERGHLRKKKVIIGKKHYDSENGKYIGMEIIRRCPKPESLTHLMKEYWDSLGELAENPTVTQEDLLENHSYFEWIHPFIDGNGRVGRLLLNWLSLQHRNEFYVIESGKRKEYYSYLQSLEEKFNKKHPRISKKLAR